MIHPSAIIERGAELGSGVSVGAFSYIGPHVRLGDGCEIRQRATLTGHTTVGPGCVFFPGCVIGEIPQDVKYRGERTVTVIGEDNHFREFTTVHAGTGVGGGETRIGDHCRLLVGVHVAHDSIVGNHVIIANNVQLAGHVLIEDCVTMGGGSAIHHFVTVGRYAMLGGLSRVAQDAPPFMITTGYPAEVRGLNSPGLRRWKLAPDDIASLMGAYKHLYARRSRNVPFLTRLETLEEHCGTGAAVATLARFLRRSVHEGKRGRYLESHRRDTDKDRAAFYAAKAAGER